MRNRGELFRVTVSAGESGETRLAVQGELDSAAAQELAGVFSDAIKREELEQAGRARPPARIMLDLEGVDFIDSGGLRMLIAIQRQAEGGDIELTVLSPPDAVTQLLHLAGAAERMNLVRGDEAAEPEVADFLERVELEFEADDRAPSRARAAVRESLGPVVSDSALGQIVLMTSELVTNGVVHSTGGLNVGLRVTTLPDSVRVEVDDPGVGFDPSGVPDEVPAPELGGRGLFVVDRYSTRWGTRRSDTDRGRRFSVWFELDSEAG